MGLLRTALSGILHPFASPTLLPGQPLSPLDAAAERLGLPAVEALFTEHPAVRRIAVAFGQFLGDKTEGTRALKKDYHIALERRLRAMALHLDPADGYGLGPLPLGRTGHPLDGHALRLLGRAADASGLLRAGGLGRAFRHWLQLLAWAAAFVGGMVFVLVTHGRPRVVPRVPRVATADFWEADFWTTFDDVLKDAGLWSDDCLLMVRERGGLEQVPFPMIEPGALPVPVGPWLRRVVGPGVRLVAAILAAAVSGRRDPRVVEAAVRALNLAATSLNIWRIAFNIRPRWYLDIMDYSAVHNLKAVVFRSFGTGLVYWPYHQLESPGSALSYFGYDLFLSGGNYQFRQYGSTWNPNMEVRPVGQIRNDRRIAYGPRLVRAHADRLTAWLDSGEKMAVLFTGNDDPGFRGGSEMLFRTVLGLFAGRKGWFLVIKPKKTERPGGVLQQMREEEETSALMEHDNVILLPCDESNPEVCPSAWLIEQMSLGASLPGSIQWEGLAMGKPLVSLFPVNQDTPAIRFLKDEGLLFETADGFKRRVEEIVARPGEFSVPLDRIHDDFDIYGDDQALGRICEALFSTTAQPIERK